MARRRGRGRAPAGNAEKLTLVLANSQPTPFFGRQTEIAELTECLTNPDCRLVTLMGTGGAGKTRLAGEVAARLHNRFPDGVCFVSLSSLASPALPSPAAAVTVAAAVARRRVACGQFFGSIAYASLLARKPV